MLSSDSRSLQVYLWNRGALIVSRCSAESMADQTSDLSRYTTGAEYKSASNIVNVIPADFDQDGRLDVLLMYGGEKNGWWGGEADTLGMEVILGTGSGSFGELPHPLDMAISCANIVGDKWTVPSSSSSQQPLIFDSNGSLRPSLLGFSHIGKSSASSIQAWMNDGHQLRL